MSKSVFYDQNKALEDEDIHFLSQLYQINLYDRDYVIAIGQERKLVAKKNTYWFPVYLIHEKLVYKQIGAYQFESTEKTTAERIKPFLDVAGDIDVNRLGELILYTYADYDFFAGISTTMSVNPSKIHDYEVEFSEKETDLQQTEKSSKNPIDIDEDEDQFSISEKQKKRTAQMAENDELLKEGIFEKEVGVSKKDLLDTETDADAKRMKTEYRESSKTTWLEKFMENNHYAIIDTATNGDCFFDAIRLAFNQIGLKTTVEILRAIVSNAADETLFEQYSTIYNAAKHESLNIPNVKKTIKAKNADLSKKMRNATTDTEKIAIKKAADDLVNEFKILQENEQNNAELLKEFGFMEGVSSLEALRSKIKTSDYWADEWAIGVIEQKLECKTIILSQTQFEGGDKNAVLQCGQSATHDNVESSPKHYIILEYSGNHYRLVSYKQRYILKFSEIPYDLKKLVVIKCMERNAGNFFKIREFKQFREELGVEISDTNNDEDDDTNDDNYNSSTVFMFYHKSASSSKAGKGSGERITAENMKEYSELNSKKNADWRRKLDDWWSAQFSLDGLKWQSVEHYYQAAKFKNKNRPFYETFALDSDSDISKDVELARIAGSSSGKKKDKIFRPKNIKIDPDFYGGRNREEREKALYSKFSQNADLKEILLLTKTAKLTHYVAKDEPEIDHSLMRLRKILQQEQR